MSFAHSTFELSFYNKKKVENIVIYQHLIMYTYYLIMYSKIWKRLRFTCNVYCVINIEDWVTLTVLHSLLSPRRVFKFFFYGGVGGCSLRAPSVLRDIVFEQRWRHCFLKVSRTWFSLWLSWTPSVIWNIPDIPIRRYSILCARNVFTITPRFSCFSFFKWLLNWKNNLNYDWPLVVHKLSTAK